VYTDIIVVLETPRRLEPRSFEQDCGGLVQFRHREQNRLGPVFLDVPNEVSKQVLRNSLPTTAPIHSDAMQLRNSSWAPWLNDAQYVTNELPVRRRHPSDGRGSLQIIAKLVFGKSMRFVV
jgi:hypothetical protein